MKIVFWLDIPSHHQSAFLSAISRYPGIDLQVRYRNAQDTSRIKQGWTAVKLFEYEKVLPFGILKIEKMDGILVDWQERIHIFSFRVFPDLLSILDSTHVRWFHWAERGGQVVASLTGFRPWLYRLLMPVYLYLWKLKDSWILRHKASGVLCLGRLNREYFRTLGVPEGKLHDLYYAVAPVAEVSPDKEIEDFAHGRKCLLYMGSLQKRKGIDLLIRAFAQLNASDWCLILCGSDFSNGKYEQLVRKIQRVDSIMFYGKCSSDRTAAIYHSADVFVFPTRYDGWGMVLQEAASSGLPLIGTDMAGASFEVIVNGQNGIIIPSDNVNALTEAMRFFVEESEQIAKYGEKSKRLFQEKMSVEKNVERLFTCLTACKNGK